MTIFHATPDFDFSKVHLASPSATSTGAYFTKINHTMADNALYMYTPKGGNKGVVTSGNKKYVDLVFTNANTNFVEWVHEFETTLQDRIYEKRQAWFTEELERDDIESVFVPIIKAVKGGQYILRAYLQQCKTRFPTLPPVFDDSETPRTLDHVQPSSDLITILDFQGVRFTSKSFAVVVVIKQIMVMDNAVPTFHQCLIKPNVRTKIVEVNTEDLIVDDAKNE
jgi:hypothetical protein